MANSDLTLTIRAQTAEFVKAIKDIESKTKVIANQMSEIDKQLKMENVDRVQKLTEKIQALDKMLNNARNETAKYVEILNLQKTSLANAEKEVAKKQIALEKLDREYKEGKISVEEYEKQHEKLTAEYESGQKSIEKARGSVESYAEKVKLAEQKSLTLAEQLKKTANEFEQEKTSADKTESELADLADTTEEFADASDKAEKETEETSKAIENAGNAANSASNDVNGFGKSVLANLASAAIQKGISVTVDLFKKLAEAAWDVAKGIVSTAWDWAQAGANLIETQNKVDAVFLESSETIKNWADNAAHDLRTTKQNAMETAASFGNIFVNMGFTREEAAKYSMDLVEAAAAQADFNNLGTEEVLQKIQSALTGNYQGLKALGIVMNEDAVIAKALEMNQGKVKEELTELDKELARITLIMNGSVTAQEKYKENSGSLVSLTAELKSRFTDLRDEIGSKLTPVFETLFQKIADYISSEEGQELLNNIIDKVEELANDLIEFINSGGVQQFLEEIKNKLPEIWDSACKLAEALGVVVDFILELSQPSQYDQLKELDAAIKSSKKEVHAFAESANIDMNSLREYIKAFAEENHLKLADVYNNWTLYEPLIAQYMEETNKAAEDMKDGVTNATESMSEQVQEDMQNTSEAVREGVSDIAGADISGVRNTTESVSELTDEMKDNVSSNLSSTADNFENELRRAGNADTSGLYAKTSEVESLGQRIRNALANFVDNSGWFQNAPGAEYANWTPFRAGGGPVSAGRMYRVNDDHGRQIETFVPAVDGYILNGNDTQRIVNNPTNNSRSYGDLIVNVNSYGTDAATIAEEIGQAVNRKMRLSGVW